MVFESPACATSSEDPATAYNDLRLPDDAKVQFALEVQSRNIYTDVLETLGSLFSKEDIPRYEVLVLHRHYNLKNGEVMVSSRDGDCITVKPMTFTEKLVEERWDSSGRPIRYRKPSDKPSDTNDNTVSKPSQKFWDDFKRLTVSWGITILGVGVAPSDAVSLIEKGNVLMGRPGLEDREQVVTVEHWSRSAFSNGWLPIKPNNDPLPCKPNQVSDPIDHRSSLNTSDEGLDYTSDGWLDYAANAPLGRMHHRMHHHMLTQPPQPPNTTAGDNCVNQCGPALKQE